MPLYNLRKNYPVFRLIIILVFVTVVLLLLPIRVPFSVSSHGKIFPGTEWVIVKDDGGRISATLHDRIGGRIDNYRVHQFERQDAVRFKLLPHIRPGSVISAGDTLGRIYSAQLDREIVALTGDLAIARASLSFYLSGEKEAVIEEAQKRLAYAEQQIEGYSILLERQKELHKRELISDQELDIAKQQARLYEIDKLIAEAQLQSALTGAKSEQIGYINARIKSLENEIESLRRTSDEYHFISPINGLVHNTFSQDTLALIGAKSKYIAVIPVPLQYRGYVMEGQEVRIAVPGGNKRIMNISVHSVGNTVRIIDGGQFFMVGAVIDTDEAEYIPGVYVSARIYTDSVTFREYIMRYLRPIL